MLQSRICVWLLYPHQVCLCNDHCSQSGTQPVSLLVKNSSNSSPSIHTLRDGRSMVCASWRPAGSAACSFWTPGSVPMQHTDNRKLYSHIEVEECVKKYQLRGWLVAYQACLLVLLSLSPFLFLSLSLPWFKSRGNVSRLLPLPNYLPPRFLYLQNKMIA